MRRVPLTELAAAAAAVAGGCALTWLVAGDGGAAVIFVLALYVPLAGAAMLEIVRQARLLRLMRDGLQRLSESSGMHVYTGVMRPGGPYRDTFTGPRDHRFATGSSFAEWLEAIDVRDRERYEAAFSYEALSRGEPVEAEFRITGSDGVSRWVTERVVPHRHGRTIKLDGVVIDQTPDRIRERHSAEQQAALARLVDATGARFFSGRFLADGSYCSEYVDPGITGLIGVAGEIDLKDLPDRWYGAVHPDDSEIVAELNRANIRGETGEAVYRLVGEDGVTRWVLERAHATPADDGEVAVSGFVLDRTERMAADQELQRTRAFLERIIEDHQMHAYAGRVLADGSYIEEFTGPGLIGVLGAPIPDGRESGEFWVSRIHPDDHHTYLEHNRKQLVDGPYEVRYRIVRTDGEVRHLHDRGVSRSLEDGTWAIEGIVTDVTGQVAAGEELRAMHERLAEALRESRAHIFQIAIGGDEGYEAVYVGPGLGDVLAGEPPDGVEMAAYWGSRVLAEDRELYEAGTAQQLRGEPADFEYRIVRLDGEVRWVWERSHAALDSAGRKVLTGVISDVTERRAVADEARAAHERLQAILAGVGQVVFTCDVETREVIYTAGDWQGLLDGVFTEPLTESRRRMHPEDRPNNERVWEAVAGGREMEQLFRIVGCDGAIRWLRERVVPRRDPSGRLLIDGVAVDVTAFLAAEQALGEAQARIASIVETIEEFLFTFEALPDGFRVDHVGPGFDRLVGGEPPEGVPVLDVWQERLHPDDVGLLREHLEESRATESEVELRLLGFDGATRWVWVRSRPRPAGERLLIDGIVSDVTERVLAAAALERLSRNDPLTGIANRRYFSELAQGVLERGGRGAAGLLLFDIDHFKRVNDVYGHAAGDAVMRDLVRRVNEVLPKGAMAARWGGEEFVVLLQSSGRDDLRRVADRLRQAAAEQPFSFAGVELTVTISCGGALADGDESLDTLVNAADQALYAAKRRGRDRTVLADELVDADLVAEDPEALRIAEAMARATAAREGVPEQHCHRVAELAVRVGSRLGLPSGVITRLRIGGWLHDIGKIAIPDRILSKPGRLDAAEWEIMQSHTILGMRLVEETPGLAEASLAVAHHHERWDGDGYPSGLAGEAIPIEARIVAAVDAWSAMTEDRPYRPGLSFDAAIAEMRRVAGSQLDPAAVAALVEILLEEHPAAAEAA